MVDKSVNARQRLHEWLYFQSTLQMGFHLLDPRARACFSLDHVASCQWHVVPPHSLTLIGGQIQPFKERRKEA